MIRTAISQYPTRWEILLFLSPGLYYSLFIIFDIIINISIIIKIR